MVNLCLIQYLIPAEGVCVGVRRQHLRLKDGTQVSHGDHGDKRHDAPIVREAAKPRRLAGPLRGRRGSHPTACQNKE